MEATILSSKSVNYSTVHEKVNAVFKIVIMLADEVNEVARA